jgi:penicillin-binding protein 1A
MLPQPVPTEPQGLLARKAQLQAQRMPIYTKIVRWAWIATYIGIASVASIFLVINYTAIPSFRDLEDPKSALASEVLANNGEVLGRYYVENRVPVTFDELSPWLEKALVSTEDERFYNHCGIDARAVGRVVFRTILMRDQSAGGGSTITQQLAKMLYSDRNFEGMGKIEKTFAIIYRKLREWITAVKLEKAYTKQEIIAMYLNQADFVNNAYGIRAASEIYFNVKPKDLKTEEAALLVGMLQNPSRNNPISRPEKSIRRRMTVLSQMRHAKHLTEDEYRKLAFQPLDMSRFRKVTYAEDRAPYMCAELRKDLGKILEMPECRKPDGSTYNIYRDGLKIYTTIDPIYQKYAEESMREHMKGLQRRFFEVWKGRDPWTYKTDETKDEEIALRREKLQQLARGGDRYAALRPKYLDPILDEIEKETGYEITDYDIENLFAEERKKGSYSRLLARKAINLDQATAYRKVLDSPNWAKLKSKWNELIAANKKAMETRTRMRVFTWNRPEMYKDTFMSPMDSIKYHRMFLQNGILAVDPATAEVKAWVGGNNFSFFKFDHVRTHRQVGSTFKPFIYSTAMAQQGLTPCFQVYDMPTTIPARYQEFRHGQDWTPRNATNSYTNRLMTLREALKNSVNSVSTYLMKQMGGTSTIMNQLALMGVDTTGIPNSPTICLGACDLTVFDMTGAYGTFANNGVYAEPYVIKEIRNKNGKVIYRAAPEERLAFPASANYMINDMLQYNVKGAPGISQLKSQVGGKTGTTNDYTDGWFMGITPRLVVGVWVGGEDRWIRFNSLADGQGARMARPMFAGLIKRLEQDKTSGYDMNAKFKIPNNPPDLACTPAAGASMPSGESFDDEEGGGNDSYNDQQAPSAPTPTGGTKPTGTTPATNPPTKPKRPDAGFNGN